jgi:uncharacterized integral membrane protein
MPSTSLGSILKQDVGAWHKAGHDEGRIMFRKIVTAIIVVPLVVAIVAFAVANRQAVTVSFDPFSAASPAYAATLPLFTIIFAVLILGVLIGGIAAWFRQGKWRRAARKLDGEVRALHGEMDTIRRRFGTSEKPLAPLDPEPSPLAVIPPPVP